MHTLFSYERENNDALFIYFRDKNKTQQELGAMPL